MFLLKMKVKINSFAGAFINGLSEANYSYSAIIKKCFQKGLSISKSTVSNIIKNANNNLTLLKDVR